MPAPGLEVLSGEEAVIAFVIGLPFALIGWYLWNRGGEGGKYGFFLLVIGGFFCLPAVIVLATIASAVIGVLIGLGLVVGIIALIILAIRN